MKILDKERIFFRNVKEINRICSLLNLTKYQCEELKRIYKNLVWSDKTQGIQLEKLLASILYHIVRRDNYNLTMKEICKKLELDFYATFRTYKKLKRKLNWRYTKNS